MSLETGLLLVIATCSLAALGVHSSKKTVDYQERKRELNFWKSVEVGQKQRGIVKLITSYGVFVRLCGDIDGFIHISDLSWDKIAHPGELLQVGDRVSAYVKAVDIDNQKISLCLKKQEDDPWLVGTKSLKVGDVVRCNITRILTYGAYAEISPSVVGLIPTSQASRHNITLPTEVFHIGDEIEAKVTAIREDIRRLDLSVIAV